MDGFTVVIPAKDEAVLLPATLEGLGSLRQAKVAHVVVVDDGSKDATAEYARDGGAHVLEVQKSRGKAAALTVGVVFAVRLGLRGDSGLLFLDADVGDSVAGVGPVLERVASGHCDLAIARYTSRGPAGGRGLVVGLASRAIEARTGWVPTVPLSGIRAMTWAAYTAVSPLAPGWGVETAMTIDALRAGLRVEEIDTPLTHRATSNTWRGQVHRGRQYLDVQRALRKRPVT